MPVDGDIILKAGLDTTGVSKQLDKLQKTVSKGLKNALRIGLGVRSVFSLIRKMRKALVEGFENLAQVHEPFNRAMSDIMTSLNLLKNTFAAAFDPIIETVAPILTKFINMIAAAVSQIGQFIAALTGKEYVQAASVQVDYASSVNKSTASTNKATNATKKQTKAQKELNKEITHFDDLVILHSDKDNDTDTSTTPTTTTPDYAFSTMPIGNAVSQFAKDFLAALEKADFTDIGRKVGEKLKSALENIPWDKIKETLSKVAQSIATFLNGFLETPGLFTTIGKTIAEAINSAVLFANTFIRTFHWDSLGTAVRERLIAVLTNLDWNLIFDTFRGFASGLANYLNELFKPETFEAIGDTVGNLIRGALIFLNTFGQTANFKQFGVSLATGINSALKKISPFRLIAGAVAIIKAIRDAIIGFMGTVNWYDLGVKLRTIIKNIPWKFILASVGQVIWSAINAAVDLFKGLFDTDNIGGPIQTALENLTNTINEAAQRIDFAAIGDGLARIVKALKPAGEGFAIGFIEAFRIFIEMGQALLEALGPALQKIADALESVDPKIVKIVAGIGTGLGLVAGSLFAISLVHGAATLLWRVGAAILTLHGLIPRAITLLAGGGTGAGAGAAAGGLAAALSLVAAAALGAAIGLELGKVEIADTTEELQPYNKAHADTITILQSLADQYGLTNDQVAELAWEMQGLTEEGSDFDGVMRLLDKNVANAGINVDDFKSSLADACSVARTQGKDISTVQTYIDGVGTSATESESNTSQFANSFGAFNGLSITAPLKMALLSGAIKSLGDSGKISKEDTNELYKVLDDWKADPTEENMNRVATAFENTGISADDFGQAVTDAMLSASGATKKEMEACAKAIANSGSTLQSNAESSFGNVGKGATKSLKEASKEVATEGTNMTNGLFNAVDDAADSHSPSKEAIKRGQFIGDGLKIGLKNRQSVIVNTANTIINAIKTKIDSFLSKFSASGTNLMRSFNNGITSGGRTLSTTMSRIVQSMYASAGSLNFYNVGRNIAMGIYNGLLGYSSWLTTLAWNTAVAMYNSACRALSIASPSKKFAYIGEMVATGLGNGVADNQDVAVDAVTDMTKAMTDEAENANPSITISSSIDTWIDDLDNVLTTFSDTVIDKFDNLVTVLAQLGNIDSNLPAIAQGRVIPSSIQASNSTNDNMSNVIGMLENLQSLAADRMDVSELRDLLTEMFTRYMNFSIGDEQLARHANNGNRLLDRRYNTVRS